MSDLKRGGERLEVCVHVVKVPQSANAASRILCLVSSIRLVTSTVRCDNTGECDGRNKK